MIPPDEDADFVVAMEQVLDVYARPKDPKRPVVAMDERPVVLHQHLRAPVPGKPGRIARIDYEYKRRGTDFCFHVYRAFSRVATRLDPRPPHRCRLGSGS
ncbi:hypothetical protein F4X88_10365 [Candidatus Poribacteria bacterium]|nr:hypothetical protein [Candidatus Poribacteria bacterium]MYA56688.1 hypothetical protein [Candidatus Poribacteria bacterium]